MARRQGATREHVLCDLLPRRNAGAGTFSTQPSGPQFFGRISASLARPVSQWIQALRWLLEIRPNSLRRLASHTGYTTLTGLRRSSDPFEPFAVRGKIGHPVSASASLFFIRPLQPAHRLRKILLLPRNDAQRIIASDEHLVSPFGKWKLCGIVGSGEKLFSRALLVTVIGQDQAAPEIDIRQREHSLVSNPLLVSIPREPSQMMFKFLFDRTALLPLLPLRKQSRQPWISRPDGSSQGLCFPLRQWRAALCFAQPACHVLIISSKIIVRLRVRRLLRRAVPDRPRIAPLSHISQRRSRPRNANDRQQTDRC